VSAERFEPSDFPPIDPASLTEDDIGNARRFVAMHGERFRFVSTFASPWLVWDGSRWAPARLGEHVEAAKQTADALLASGASARHLRESRRLGRLLAMLRLAESDPAIAREAAAFDAEPWLLNVGNGTVDLRTGELREHRPQDHLTLLAGGSFEPEAPAPTWRRFLVDVLPDPELRDYLDRLLGCAVFGLPLEHILAILWGAGANGKSTLLGAVAEALGEYAHQAPASILTSSRSSGGATPDLADLRGRRLVTVSETREDARLSIERVKAITGGDPITARYLYAQPFTFRPSHTIILQTNHRPRVADDGHAIWRRLRLVPFTETIPAERQRRELPQELAAERDGVLSSIVAGALTYLASGLVVPESVELETSAYREAEDDLGAWLEECCELDVDVFTPSRELLASFDAWARSSGAETLSRQMFADRLKARAGRLGIVAGRDRRREVRGWRGIALRNTHRQESLTSSPPDSKRAYQWEPDG
jgi:putative DNA primase/helicase